MDGGVIRGEGGAQEYTYIRMCAHMHTRVRVPRCAVGVDGCTGEGVEQGVGARVRFAGVAKASG